MIYEANASFDVSEKGLVKIEGEIGSQPYAVVMALIQALRAERERVKELERLIKLAAQGKQGIWVEIDNYLSSEASGWPEFWPPPWVESEE